MTPLRIFAILFSCASIAFAAEGKDGKPEAKQIAKFQKVMKTIGELQYQTGEITLIGGKAKIKLTDEFRYLDSANARKVLVDIWDNPPETGNTQGMIVPKDV